VSEWKTQQRAGEVPYFLSSKLFTGEVLQLGKEGKRDSQQEEATKYDDAAIPYHMGFKADTNLGGQRAAQAAQLWDAAGRGGITTSFLSEILETESKIQFLPVVQIMLSFQTNVPDNGN
jgi:hypothetical protein